MRSLLLLAMLGLASAQVDVKQLTTCKAALRLVPALKAGPQGHTIFCPTNDAFDSFAEDLGFYEPEEEGGKSASNQLLARMAGDPALTSVIAYHVVQGVLPTAALADGAVLPTLAGGAPLKVVNDDGDVTVVFNYVDYEDPEADDPEAEEDVEFSDATFDGAFKKASSKYVVHAMGAVLTPPSAAGVLRQMYAAANEKK
ncbi:MAG: hypothetical protein J3K34DRAFT_421676 [Monoraphidium minutum]|nr:MAG: hypothetical protein J3K34DRAFT_421676 [Monoraphidium minutum]